MKIPFMKIVTNNNEERYVIEALGSGHHSGNGPFTKKCHDFIEKEFRIKKVLLTTSCTDALEMCAFLINGMPGDEFIAPSFTFSSTVNAFASKGMIPVYIDIKEDTLNINETQIEDKITKKTKAIVVVHYSGIPCEMDMIKTIAKTHKIPVIEDAAQAVNSKYKGNYAGSLTELGTFSFHDTKNYSCGEGGAITINDASYMFRSESLWEKGTCKTLMMKGLKEKYTWVDYGSSFLPSDILSAMLLAQLENKEKIQDIRKRVFLNYFNKLSPLLSKGLQTITIPDFIEPNYHAFWILLPSQRERERFINSCTLNEITPCTSYMPLHSSPMGIFLGGNKYHLPITDSVSNRIARLPFYLMNDKEMQYCSDRIYKILKNLL